VNGDRWRTIGFGDAGTSPLEAVRAHYREHLEKSIATSRCKAALISGYSSPSSPRTTWWKLRVAANWDKARQRSSRRGSAPWPAEPRPWPASWPAAPTRIWARVRSCTPVRDYQNSTHRIPMQNTSLNPRRSARPSGPPRRNGELNFKLETDRAETLRVRAGGPRCLHMARDLAAGRNCAGRSAGPAAPARVSAGQSLRSAPSTTGSCSPTHR